MFRNTDAYSARQLKTAQEIAAKREVTEECRKKLIRRWKAWTKDGQTLLRKLRRSERYAAFLEDNFGVKL